ncbi:MAG: hypothetical protein CSA15_12990 [Candidatus Delongbacteria bacterium]|nr:MAG: hypothetical protein CSA15_12990 [Candidatus Delongbacteria bacterium]
MKRSIVLLILFFAISIFGKKHTYKIGVLADVLKVKDVEFILNKLDKEIKAVVGEDAYIVLNKESILQNRYSIEKAKSNYKELLNSCDIIFCFGNYDLLVLKQEKSFPKPVIAFGNLGNGEKIDKNSTSGIDNLLYFTYSENILSQLEILKELVDFETVGIVVEENVSKIENFGLEYRELLKENGINYKLIKYKTLDNIIDNLDGVDVLDLEASFSLNQNEIRKLSKILIEKKIPSFSDVRFSDVKNGIMITNIADDNFTQFFRRIALSVNSYINGTNFSQLPVLIDFTPEITINYTTAMALGVPLNYSMIGEINFIDKSPINPNAKKVYDLPTLISEVLDKNLSLKSRAKEVEIKENDLSLAKSSYLPSLKASAQGVYLDPELAKLSQGSNAEITTSGNLSLQQLVFSEKANTNIRVGKKVLKAQKEKLNTEELDIVFDAVKAYFNLLILKSNVTIQLNNLSLTKYNLKIAEENYNAGKSGITDLLRFKSQKAQNTQMLVESINRLQKSYNYLNLLTDNELNYRIDIKDAKIRDNIFKEYNYDGFMEIVNNPLLRLKLLDFLVDEALRNSPEIKQLSYNLEMVEEKRELYGWKRFLPQVAIQGQYNYQFSKSGKGSSYPQGYPTPPDGSYNIGLNVTIPLFDKNSNNINRETALIQKDQLEINRKNYKKSISLNIRHSILSLIDEISNIELSKVSEEAAKKALELTQNAYSEGAVNIVQLIDAQNNYMKTQEAKTNASYNYLIQMVQLERYLGNYFLLDSEDEIADFEKRFLEFANKSK